MIIDKIKKVVKTTISYNDPSIKEVFAKQKYGWVQLGANILCCVS